MSTQAAPAAAWGAAAPSKLHPEVLKKKLSSLLSDILRVGCVRGFKHFQMWAPSSVCTSAYLLVYLFYPFARCFFGPSFFLPIFLSVRLSFVFHMPSFPHLGLHSFSGSLAFSVVSLSLCIA